MGLPRVGKPRSMRRLPARAQRSAGEGVPCIRRPRLQQPPAFTSALLRARSGLRLLRFAPPLRG